MKIYIFKSYSSLIGSSGRVSSILESGVFFEDRGDSLGGALVSAANVYLQFSMLERYRQYLPHGWSSQVRGTLDIFRYWSGIGFLYLRIRCQVVLEVGVIGSSAGAT